MARNGAKSVNVDLDDTCTRVSIVIRMCFRQASSEAVWHRKALDRIDRTAEPWIRVTSVRCHWAVEHFIIVFISSRGLVVRATAFRAGGCRFEPQSVHFTVVSSDKYLR